MAAPYDKIKHDMEQATAAMRDMMPALWYGLYRGCVEKGFNPDQAIHMVYAYILSQCPAGIQPGTGGNPKPEDE